MKLLLGKFLSVAVLLLPLSAVLSGTMGDSWRGSTSAIALLAIGTCAGFALWIWMLVDFFRLPDGQRKTWVAIVLVLFSVGAAVAYFFFKFGPQQRRAASLDPLI